MKDTELKISLLQHDQAMYSSFPFVEIMWTKLRSIKLLKWVKI